MDFEQTFDLLEIAVFLSLKLLKLLEDLFYVVNSMALFLKYYEAE